MVTLLDGRSANIGRVQLSRNPRSRSLLVLPFALAFAAACSSESASSNAPPAIATSSLAMSMAVSVPAGAEQHRCRFVKVDPAYDGYIVEMSHEYTPGSHHLVLFRTDLTDIPSGQSGDLDCYGAGSEVMSHTRGVLYASQSATGKTTLPPSVGLPIRGGSVLMLQSHYLNAGVSALDAKVDVRLAVAPRSDAIKDEAGVLFYYDPFIVVPPRGRSSALMRCRIAKDIHLLTGLSHTHKRGVGFEAFVDPPSGELSPTPFYTSNDWEHPQSFDSKLDVPAGSKIRFRCDYANPSGETEIVQGQSAETNEMCVFTGLYYPAMTAEENLCAGGADMFGAGASTCGEALDCVQKCPAGTAPKLTIGGVPDVHPCWQACFASTCPTGGAPLLAQLGCTSKQCGEACADPSGTSCASCVLQKCGDVYGACSTHKCR